MAITPMIRSPVGIGTPRYDSVRSTLNGAPIAVASSALPTRIGRPDAMIRAVRMSSRTLPWSSGFCSPSSIQYRNLI